MTISGKSYSDIRLPAVGLSMYMLSTSLTRRYFLLPSGVPNGREQKQKWSQKVEAKNGKKSSDPGSNQGPQDNKFLAEQGNYSLALFQLSYQRRLLKDF
ncbi:hypothetical protein ACN38_g3228 [Penicillium nordicum]|uniref:Uncharacterized protein n=1 Tax=Penicillium nordicum TaxID=229535 RepID=A0A0N0RZH2_9EURO|nr:hypothetical protein ACN38_g3228 [Penicillium nordicum]